MALKNIVEYFKACYQVDFKAINILNFFGKKVEQQLIVDNAELLNGKLMHFPVPTIWGEEMEKTLALHSQEKALFCCAFFLSGKMNIIGTPQKVFAPLYIYPVKLLHQNNVYSLELDADRAVINPIFLDYIKTKSPSLDLHYDDLEKALPQGYIRFDEIHQIIHTLKEFLPELNLEELNQYPELYRQEQLEETYRKRNPSLKIVPGVGVGLIQKPSGSRGILNELSKMAELNHFSPVLNEIFQPTAPYVVKNKPRKIYTPVTLSESQLKIFESCDQHRLSLVIGPPGTGKSFTIAALAVDLISRGHSVLIASKNNQAGNVIAHKIEKDFGLKGVVVKTSSKSFRTTLQKRLGNIIAGIETQKVDPATIDTLKAEVDSQNKKIEMLAHNLAKRSIDEIKWGAFFFDYKDGFFIKFKKRWIEYKVDSKRPIWGLMTEMNKRHGRLNIKLKSYIKKRFEFHLYQTLINDRKEIQTLLDALNFDTGNKMEEYFNKTNFEVILHALPAWIVNAVDVNKALPLEAGLFDVVIIDEATQCDIASSLPLLQRAKKAIIVGDPKQLRHISFLSKKQQDQFAEKLQIPIEKRSKLDYRKNSLLDLVSSSIPNQNQVHFLDEHYRSMPAIIEFSNQHFYANKLKVMTATPITLEEESSFVHWTNGKRDKKGFNEIEADEIIKRIQEIIQDESDLNKRLCQSIGVLSPFRNQVNHIKQKVRAVIPSTAITRHQLLIGTPFEFQGEERDNLLLSFVVDDESHPSTFLYLNREDVFNVSITRARSRQDIFTSVNLKKLPPQYLLTQFLESNCHSKSSQRPISTYLEHDEFVENVVEALKTWKVDHIYKAYPVGGMEIDIVVVNDGETYCIDLVGYPGNYEEIVPFERWKMLNRVGVKTFTLPYSSWYINAKVCRKALRQFLFPKKQGI